MKRQTPAEHPRYRKDVRSAGSLFNVVRTRSRHSPPPDPSRFDHDLPRHASASHVVQRGGGLFKSVALRDMRPYPAFLNPAENLLQRGTRQVGLALDMLAPEHADNARALEQREVERQLRNLAVRKPDHEIPAAPPDTAKSRLSVLTADRVVDDVGPVPVCQRLDPFAQIFARVVDGGVRAVFHAQRELFRT